MPRRDDDLLDIPSIVPDSDGRPATHVAQEATVSNVPSEHRTTVKVALPLLFLALAGACAFFHYELTKLRSENQQWSARVANLESQLGVAHSENQATRQTLEQKVTALEGSAKTRDETIKKLQQQQEAHSKAAADAEKRIAALQQQDEQLKKTIDSQAQQQNQKIAQIEAAQSKVSQTVNEQLSPLSTQVQQLQATLSQQSAQLAQANSQASEAALSSAQAAEAAEQLQRKLNEIASEQQAQRESIRSLDSFRRSANSDLNRLKQGAGAY